MTEAGSEAHICGTRSFKVQGGERELKEIKLEVFGQLIVVIKDRKY